MASEFVLEYEQIVGGCDGDDILHRVPSCVKNLLVEIEAVDADLVLFSLASRTYLLGFESGFRASDLT